MKDYQKLFANIPEVQVPATLHDAILKCINQEARKQARVRFYMFGSLAVSSFASLFFISVTLFKSLIQSGAYNYASLLFSDGATVATYWKEFTFSFVESLPVLGIVAFLSVGIVFLWTSAKALHDIRPVSLIIN